MNKNINYTSISDLPQSEVFQRVANICTAVNRVLTTKELLQISLKQTMDLFGAKRGSIFILDNNGKDLTLKISEGMKNNEQEILIKRMGEGVVGKVAQLKKPIVVDDISKDSRFSNYKARKTYKTPSFICAPLLLKDKLIGVINITDKESGIKFNHDELQLLDFLSSQIALNFHRLQLYKKFKLIVKEKQDLKEKLGETDKETKSLKRQIVIQEKLATIGKLAGGIAHEFNNPLDGVMRYTNLCLEHLKEDDVPRSYLLEVKYGLNRMANIVKNLLACSRNELPHNTKVEFHRALENVLSSLDKDLSVYNIKIGKDIDKNISAIIDFGLERILSNLIRNAIDAIKDKKQGVIDIRAYYTNDMVVFSIKDNGCGIPEAHIHQIFEPFFTSKDIEKGCGLGLTIVGEIVKNYEGKIEVESEEGVGSMFTIKIPLEKDDQ